MKISFMIPFLYASCVLAAPAFQQTQPATYGDVYAHQAVGRVIASGDGRFLLYEWSRPYLNWLPQPGGLSPSAVRRMQTFLYRVDVASEKPSSEYLFYPNAGCTYWLGGLSPDDRYVVVYELDNDEHSMRIGVWSTGANTMRWLAMRPDENRLQETAWISNDEFVYPMKGGSTFGRVSAIAGEARPCAMCTSQNMEQILADRDAAADTIRQLAGRISPENVPDDAKLLTGAANGSVAVYVRDTQQLLSLLYTRPGKPTKVLFENSRKWPPSQDAK